MIERNKLYQPLHNICDCSLLFISLVYTYWFKCFFFTLNQLSFRYFAVKFIHIFVLIMNAYHFNRMRLLTFIHFNFDVSTTINNVVNNLILYRVINKLIIYFIYSLLKECFLKKILYKIRNESIWRRQEKCVKIIRNAYVYFLKNVLGQWFYDTKINTSLVSFYLGLLFKKLILNFNYKNKISILFATYFVIFFLSRLRSSKFKCSFILVARSDGRW